MTTATSRLLDVKNLPQEQTYTCDDGTTIDVREFVEDHRPAIEALAAHGKIKDTENFGFAMAAPQFGESVISLNWDKPEEFVWFVGGWGPKRLQCIANAVRKLRPLLRTGFYSTLDLRRFAPQEFDNPVPSFDANGTFPWGDFARGGGVVVQMCELLLPGAVSCLKETEDDTVTRLILGNFAAKIVAGNKLLPNN